MFAHFDGIVAEKNADSIVLDVNGVGYLLFVSGATLSMAPAVGERMKLYSVLNVREDAMELFGFYSREEKRMYERLKGVNGVGSRTALQILSSMSVRDLSLALVAVVQRTDNLYEYTPMQIKQAVTGYGGADKHQVQQMVKMLLNMKDIARPDDAADALAVALTHANSMNMKKMFKIK